MEILQTDWQAGFMRILTKTKTYDIHWETVRYHDRYIRIYNKKRDYHLYANPLMKIDINDSDTIDQEYVINVFKRYLIENL